MRRHEMHLGVGVVLWCVLDRYLMLDQRVNVSDKIFERDTISIFGERLDLIVQQRNFLNALCVRLP